MQPGAGGSVGLVRSPVQPVSYGIAGRRAWVRVALLRRALPRVLVGADVISPRRRYGTEVDSLERSLEFQPPDHEPGHLGVGGRIQRVELCGSQHMDTMTQLGRFNCVEIVSPRHPSFQRPYSGADVVGPPAGRDERRDGA